MQHLPEHAWDKRMKQYGLLHADFQCTMTFLPRSAGFEDLGLTRTLVFDTTNHMDSLMYPVAAVMTSRAIYTSGKRLYCALRLHAQVQRPDGKLSDLVAVSYVRATTKDTIADKVQVQTTDNEGGRRKREGRED